MRRFIKYLVILASAFALIALLTRKVSYEASNNKVTNRIVFSIFYQDQYFNKKEEESELEEDSN